MKISMPFAFASSRKKSWFMMIIITLLTLSYCTTHVNSTLSKDDKEEIEKITNESISDHLNSTFRNMNWTDTLEKYLKPEHVQRIVVDYLKRIEIREAFRQTTGHRLETILIIVACVMILPGLLANVIFTVCLNVLKGSGKVVTKGASCACTTVCCCCKKIICCCKDSS